MESEEGHRVAVICTSCRTVYAARRCSDGTVQPIGKSDTCSCGAGTFRIVDDAVETVSEGE